MRRSIFLYKYMRGEWKLVFHLLFRTKRFGVNNQKWSSFDSMYGWTARERFINILKVKPIIMNYKMMFVRSAIGFIPWEDFMQMISRRQFEKMYPNRDYKEEMRLIRKK